MVSDILGHPVHTMTCTVYYGVSVIKSGYMYKPHLRF